MLELLYSIPLIFVQLIYSSFPSLSWNVKLPGFFFFWTADILHYTSHQTFPERQKVISCVFYVKEHIDIQENKIVLNTVFIMHALGEKNYYKRMIWSWLFLHVNLFFKVFIEPQLARSKETIKRKPFLMFHFICLSSFLLGSQWTEKHDL